MALMINGIIGGGIFGVPGKLIAELGRASPLAMIVAGLLMSVVVLCFMEVGSRFSEQGGVYLYSRTAFGKWVGLQVAWFWFLSVLGGAAANAILFTTYLEGFAPWAVHGWPRLLVLTLLIGLPAAANYAGTRKGTALSNVFTVAKLAPLALIIGLGLLRFSRHAELITVSEITAPGWSAWGAALLALFFVFGGFEDSTMPTAEVKEPRRNLPFALLASLGACTLVYTLLQFVIVATPATAATERPLAAPAEALLGHGGVLFVEIAAMLSTYGWISGSMLNVPRLLFSMSSQKELPAALGELHPRFNTPHIAVLVFAFLTWVLAATGTFEWSLMISAGAGNIYYLVICAALLRLRYLQPGADAFRLPFGPFFSVAGVVICLVLLTGLGHREALLMTVTAAMAAINWFWTRKRTAAPAQVGGTKETVSTVSPG